MELDREFVERCHEDVYYLLYTLNQRYREEIDNNHVFVRGSKEKERMIND